MTRIFRKSRRNSQAGVALVEFALVLPILMVLLFGMIDFGKAFNYWIDETHLANEAARWAAVNKSPDSTKKIEEALKEQANTPELKNGGGSVASPGVTISFCFPSGSTGQVGEPVRATASSTYRWLQFLIGELNFTDTSLVATATMRLEAKYDGSSYTAAACT